MVCVCPPEGGLVTVRRLYVPGLPKEGGLVTPDTPDFVLVTPQLRHLDESPVGPDTHRAETHVEIGEADPEEAHPSPHHVAPIQAADAVVAGLAHRPAGEAVEITADDVT